ncbi:hypothetical protein ACSBOX_06015 [Arthrobacter sp. KN11-1C]|uniref:hypothetical protein n=1 Tax=Arthrobacter sp. KN11-1C TaxID=3445774 RepID=UPI003F9EE0AA
MTSFTLQSYRCLRQLDKGLFGRVRRRKERCSLCGKDRIIGYRTSAGKALCKACGRAKEPCTDCGRTRTVVARHGGAAFCDYCNRKNPAFFLDCRRCGRHEKLRKDIWRIGRQDVEDYIAEAYRRTAERIAAGEISDDGETGDQE